MYEKPKQVILNKCPFLKMDYIPGVKNLIKQKKITISGEWY